MADSGVRAGGLGFATVGRIIIGIVDVARGRNGPHGVRRPRRKRRDPSASSGFHGKPGILSDMGADPDPIQPDPIRDETGFARLKTKGGLDVRIRSATPDDEDLLIEGFEQLSDESRYQRFFTPTPHLSPSTVDRLLDAGSGHVILVAFARSDRDRSWTPAGGIRAVWLKDKPGTAELAVTVIDAYQGRGLGTLLTAALATVVAEQGITTLSAEVLARNTPMLTVLRSFGAEMQSHPDDATVVTARLDTTAASARLPTREREDLLAAVTPGERDRATTIEPG